MVAGGVLLAGAAGLGHRSAPGGRRRRQTCTPVLHAGRDPARRRGGAVDLLARGDLRAGLDRFFASSACPARGAGRVPTGAARPWSCSTPRRRSAARRSVRSPPALLRLRPGQPGARLRRGRVARDGRSVPARAGPHARRRHPRQRGRDVAGAGRRAGVLALGRLPVLAGAGVGSRRRRRGLWCHPSAAVSIAVTTGAWWAGMLVAARGRRSCAAPSGVSPSPRASRRCCSSPRGARAWASRRHGELAARHRARPVLPGARRDPRLSVLRRDRPGADPRPDLGAAARARRDRRRRRAAPRRSGRWRRSRCGARSSSVPGSGYRGRASTPWSRGSSTTRCCAPGRTSTCSRRCWRGSAWCWSRTGWPCSPAAVPPGWPWD